MTDAGYIQKERVRYRAITLLLLCVMATAMYAQEPPVTKATPVVKRPRVTHIRINSGSGMCYGYCAIELNVEPGEAVMQKLSRDDQKKCPSLQVKANLSNKHWEELVQLVDHNAVFALPDIIGSPGSADEVTEAIEITFSDHTKKSVFYDMGSAPSELKDLSTKLEALQQKLEKEFPPTTQCSL